MEYSKYYLKKSIKLRFKFALKLILKITQKNNIKSKDKLNFAFFIPYFIHKKLYTVKDTGENFLFLK